MPTAQHLLRDVLRDLVAPVLRQHGYGGSGQDFHRQIDGNWAAINFQRGRYATAQELRFTINLGTASTAARAEDGIPPDEPAREIECHWRNRLNSMLPDHPDDWWTVKASMTSDALARLGREVAEALVVYGLPELARRASDEAILALELPGDAAPGLSPFAMDMVGPILRRIGPPDRLARYLAVIDADGGYAADVYTMWDDFGPPMGAKRITKAIDRLSAAGFEPRQQAIIDLGFAAPTDEIRSRLRPLLEDSDWRIRFAAAQALGRVGDVPSLGPLLTMVESEPVRYAAVHAAFALWRLDKLIAEPDRARIRTAIAQRRNRAVGADRAALSELLRRMG